MASNSVTKSKLSAAVASAASLDTKKSTEVVDTIIDSIKTTLAKGEEVLVSGFGKFVVLDKKERTGRNPKTGEPVVIASRRVTKFRPSDLLKSAVNERLV